MKPLICFEVLFSFLFYSPYVFANIPHQQSHTASSPAEEFNYEEWINRIPFTQTKEATVDSFQQAERIEVVG